MVYTIFDLIVELLTEHMSLNYARMNTSNEL